MNTLLLLFDFHPLAVTRGLPADKVKIMFFHIKPVRPRLIMPIAIATNNKPRTREAALIPLLPIF